MWRYVEGSSQLIAWLVFEFMRGKSVFETPSNYILCAFIGWITLRVKTNFEGNGSCGHIKIHEYFDHQE